MRFLKMRIGLWLRHFKVRILVAQLRSKPKGLGLFCCINPAERGCSRREKRVGGFHLDCLLAMVRPLFFQSKTQTRNWLNKKTC